MSMSAKSSSAKSLLPCSCGKQIEIEISQAGLMVDCPACNRQVQAPTMRGFRELKRAETPQTPAMRGNEWGTQQGLVFLGLTIVLIGLLGCAAVWWTAPVFMPQVVLGRERNLNQYDLEKLKPVEAYAMWDSLTYTIDDPREMTARNKHAAVVAFHYRWIWVALGVCVLGLIVTAIGGIMGVLRRPKQSA